MRPAEAETPTAVSEAAAAPDDAPIGDGFVVWESNRSGDWRLWIRGFDDGAPRQLTAGEATGQHCCPHIAPDGNAVVYLRLAPGQERYPETGAAGPLHLVRPDGTGDRRLVGSARTYYEHRAAVWRGAGELIYIDSAGRTRLLDVGAQESRALTDDGRDVHGWLVNSTLTHATWGLPAFSRYDAGARRVRAGRDLGGCQPYFSHDGRWGYWIAGAGGPIRRVDLATGQVGTVLGKGDPRLPAGQAYVYFPMSSSDGRFLAFAASRGGHSHHEADYDVFVAETDPRTLDVLGPVRRITADPSTDRFPDVYSAPLALGRHFGEVPHTVELTPPDGDWTFTVNGAEVGRGALLRHTFDTPGTFEVRAQRALAQRDSEPEALTGRVTVDDARPPRVVRLDLRGGRRLVVSFDEAIEARAARVAFASGRGVAGWRAGDGGRTLIVELTADLDAADVLTLGGITDRAQVPQLLADTRLEVEPPSWPFDRRGLVFLWATDDGINEVEDPETGATRTSLVQPGGRAFLDRHRAMTLGGGVFEVDSESAKAVLESCRKTSELTLEAMVTPARRVRGPGRILTFSRAERERNFTLGQEDGRLVFRLRTRTTGKNADRPQLDLGPVAVGRPSHVVVTYTPGLFKAYVNGEQVLETEEVQSGFHHWKPRRMLFGNETGNVDRPWYGKVEGVAIYNRVMDADEAAENYRRYADKMESRPEIAVLRVRGRLRRKSAIPTLDEISPYRDALAVFEYEVLDVLRGEYSGAAIRVAQRVLLDAERTPVSQRGVGGAYEVSVTPFGAHPQVESLFLSNDVSGAGRLFFEDGIEQ